MRVHPFVIAILISAGLVSPGKTLAGTPDTDSSPAVVVSLEGSADILKGASKEWSPAVVGSTLEIGDQLRTGSRSRATIRLSNLSVLRVSELMTYQIEAPRTAGSKPVLNLKSGSAYFFSRDKPQEIQLRTPTVTGAIRGTEFNVTVKPDGETTVTMIEGEVAMSNEWGEVSLHDGDQGQAQSGRVPVKTAVINAINVIQWSLYYPGVLDVADLDLTAQEREMLTQSLAAYQRGELLEALKRYPAIHQPDSSADHLYLGGLLLAVGLVDQALPHLDASASDGGKNVTLANALRELIAAVKCEKWQSPAPPTFATEFLAESYYRQSQGELEGALASARKCVETSPSFGFGWERVAELEFSFGHTAQSLEALDRSLVLAPRNPQAHALKGFLLSAQNRIEPAITAFNEAISIDGALGNAWLGRGLCHMRRGETAAGREDLEVAASLEPNRSLLRSYLGKAFAETHDDVRARQELKLARQFDPNDPTSWLYSALLNQQGNEVNKAIRDLERSQELNDNRSVYRSRMLLDQDAAVRGANLAGIYQDAGMDDVSVREATRAVNYDYANYSAHLFLANSYNQLRDPNQINLRYETPWLSEYLVANLLAPVGAGTLSQTVSQQEYSKLFEHDRLGIASSTEYLSDGTWVQSGSQYGILGNFGYAVDTLYRSDNGYRANNEQEQLTVSAQVKVDITPQDSIFLQTIYYDASAGDLTQYYDKGSAHLDLHTDESQEPLLLAGFRHEWSPGVQTLFLAGRYDDTYKVRDTNQPVLMLARNGAGNVIAMPTPALPTAEMHYRSELESYSAEVQQIFKQETRTLVIGARYQGGCFDTRSDLGASTPTQVASMTATSILAFATAPISVDDTTEFDRFTGYGYYYWQVFEPLQLCGGVDYDYLYYPANHRIPPTSDSEDIQNQVMPKAGFTWTPLRDTLVRFAYTRSLAGVSFDQSVRLEPTQVAGFNQAFRSLMPESIVGSTAGAKFETFGLALDQKFSTGTYLGIEGQLLNSDVHRDIGVVYLDFPPTYVAGSTAQDLSYTEQNVIVTLNQLLGDCWLLGARYQWSKAELDTDYPDIPSTVSSAHHTENRATLQQLLLSALWNDPSGLFARGEAVWYSQDNSGYQPSLDGDDFWQFNLMAGYRFWRRQVQVQVGILNLTDQDYQLNPLNLYSELPHHRTFAASLQFNF